MHRTSLSILVLITLAGCKAVGPDYTPPRPAMPEQFVGLSGPGAMHSTETTADPLAPGAIASWWTSLNDPVLSGLIDRAIAGNLDLRLAEARLREARALRGIEDTRRFPTVDATAGASRRRDSENTGQPGIGTDDVNNFQIGVDASWELDVFGGIRRSIEAADADLMAAEEDRRAILVSLAAEVALNYVELRQFQQRRFVADNSIKTQRDTVDLTRSRLDAGLAAELEVAQSQAQLATRLSQRPPLLTGERAAMYRIGVLLGQHPGALMGELSTDAPPAEASTLIPKTTAAIAAGLPSDLLRRRPDIRRAERRIAGATARVGVATADLFPRFSLTGAFGLEAEELDPLFDSTSRTWLIGPAVRWNIFDRARIHRTIDAANEREQQALLAYEQTVLVALEDVENALIRLANEQERNTALKGAVASNRRAVDLADERYRSGVGDFLDVLDGQRLLYDSEDALVASDAELTRAVIALYRALGGGWQEPVPSGAEAPKN
jgi:NodT family efflux transporter outer membrane factor (OMF) lipoprotein